MISNQDLYGLIFLFAYYIGFAGIIAAVTRLLNYSGELIRKAYHIMVSLSIILIIQVFEHWYMALVGIVLLMGTAYILVYIFQKIPYFKGIRIDRFSGDTEIPAQVLYILVSMMIGIIIFWGIFGAEWKFHAVVGIIAWGFGDAAAAIFGKRFGKNHYKHPLFDQKKTKEGTYAMVVTAFIAIFITLIYLTDMALHNNILLALTLAWISGFVEAISRKGIDTIVIPLTVSFISAPLTLLLLLIWKG